MDLSKVPSFKTPPEFDHLLLKPIHTMIMTGIKIDHEKKRELQDASVQNWNKLQETLNKIAGQEINVMSTKDMRGFLYGDLGLKKRLKRTKGESKVTTDEDALRDIMAECNNKVETSSRDSTKAKYALGAMFCRVALKIRKQRKEISSYLGMTIAKNQLAGEVDLTDPDGRIRGTISIGGTETHRFSHSKTLWDTGVNLATVPRDLRSMFVADEGYELCQFDLNRGESWIYAHLSEDPELLRIHCDGLDFHSETAATISKAFGEPLDLDWIIKNKHDKAYKIRFLGKKINHASAYRMKEKVGTDSVNAEADDTGITIVRSQFKQAQQLWFNKYFMVPNSWWPSIEAQLSQDRTMTTPYGRIHQFHDFWNESLFKAATAYVPQSTSVDYMNRGLLKVFYLYQQTGAWGLKILTQTHDSILVQYKIEHRDEAIQSIQATLMSESLTIKGRTFSIPIEPEHGPNWGDLKEYVA